MPGRKVYSGGSRRGTHGQGNVEGTPSPSLTIAKATFQLNLSVSRRVMHLRDRNRALENAALVVQLRPD